MHGFNLKVERYSALVGAGVLMGLWFYVLAEIELWSVIFNSEMEVVDHKETGFNFPLSLFYGNWHGYTRFNNVP
jgi:hypothetical protein